MSTDDTQIDAMSSSPDDTSGSEFDVDGLDDDNADEVEMSVQQLHRQLVEKCNYNEQSNRPRFEWYGFRPQSTGIESRAAHKACIQI